jgi:integrase
MPRQTKDQPITTRAARERLAARAEPYWRALDAGVALGYRKARNGGTWIARVMLDGKYREGALGRADDALKPEGVTVLDYRQAEAKGRAWASAQHHKAAGLDPEHDTRAPYTIADAIRDYLADYKRRGGKGLAQTQFAVDAHILPSLGPVRADRLSRQRLAAWRDALADAPPRLRSAGGAAGQNVRELDGADPDVLRRRRASTNRVLTILKAALNHAHQSGHVGSKEAWAAVKPFREADAPTIRFLTDAEATRLVNACPADLRRIVVGALLTGMRYGEIARLRVSDFNSDAGTVTVATSKSGTPRHVVLTDEGRAFFGQVTASKPAGALAFTREDGGAWAKSYQFRPLREACAAARIAPAVSFHILRHTYASRLAVRGTPMPVIAAQLGHEGTRMTERHYAHLTPSYVAQTVRSLFGATGFVPASNVIVVDARPANR